MAFQTGTASSMDNLFSTLMTFATANGWTQDQQDSSAGSMALHKNSVYVSFRYDPAAENNISIHQALGYTGGNEPGNHPDDSGNGYNSNSSHTDNLLDNERCSNDMTNGPYPNYWFFENDASPAYLHVVVEITADVYRHFGFGEMDKVGTWTGGEYCYGHFQAGNSPITTLTSCHMDGGFGDTDTGDFRKASTIHLEGLPAQDGSSKWGQVWGRTGQAIPDDTAGNPKVQCFGGFRSGPIARHFGVMKPAGTQTGSVPMYPFGMWYRDTTNEHVYFLGWIEDVRGVNIGNFAPAQEVVIGSDTWVFFPMAQKTTDNVVNRTYNSGIAYKKVTA